MKKDIQNLCHNKKDISIDSVDIKKQFEDAQEAARAQGSEVGRHSDMKYSGSNGE